VFQKIKLIVLALLAVVAVYLAVQNIDAVQTRLFHATVTLPRGMMMFSTLALGFIAGVIMTRDRVKPKAQA